MNNQAGVPLNRPARSRICLLAIFVALLFMTERPTVRAAFLPEGFTEAIVVDNLSVMTSMAFAPDGRLFILQKNGVIRIVKNGVLLETPFLSVAVNSEGERGLLGLAFDPDFATDPYVYINYTRPGTSIHNRVSRFTADGDVAIADSEVVLLNLAPQDTRKFHIGGAVHFGGDGKLYIATGDNTMSANAQSMDTLHGKLLRIAKDGSIPTDNPFYNTATGDHRAIWATGLRNPFTFAVQPGTGRLFINDVGASRWEEVNDGLAGGNYGWPGCEGGTGGFGDCDQPGLENPVYTYAHDDSVCAITGGTFYNPATSSYPADYSGDYFFADYCAGWIKRWDANNGTVTDFAGGINAPIDLDIGPDGNLYYLSLHGGQIYKVMPSIDQPPVIHQHPAGQTVAQGQSATFTVNVSGSAPLDYQWQRDGEDIIGADGPAYMVPNVTPADDNARFRVVITNDFGTATSDEATLRVADNQPPVAQINKPAVDWLYSAGKRVTYVGVATDPEDGPLPLEAYTWRVEFHHDTHFHPFIDDTSGRKRDSFVVPRLGEPSANVWFRIHLTVRDSDGAESTTFRDVYPRTVMLTLATVPAGLQLTLDGQPVTTPHTFASVVGVKRVIGAPAPQEVGGIPHLFRRWSDRRANTHTIITPVSEKTYTATFSP